MRHGHHYDQIYSLAAIWNYVDQNPADNDSTQQLYTRQIDFVLAFPQAPVERKIHMETPNGVQINDGNIKDYVN